MLTFCLILDNNLQMFKQCSVPWGRSVRFLSPTFLSLALKLRFLWMKLWRQFTEILKPAVESKLKFLWMLNLKYLLLFRWHILEDITQIIFGGLALICKYSPGRLKQHPLQQRSHEARRNILFFVCRGQPQKYSPWHGAHFYAITGILRPARWKIMYSIKECRMVRRVTFSRWQFMFQCCTWVSEKRCQL